MEYLFAPPIRVLLLDAASHSLATTIHGSAVQSVPVAIRNRCISISSPIRLSMRRATDITSERSPQFADRYTLSWQHAILQAVQALT